MYERCSSSASPPLCTVLPTTTTRGGRVSLCRWIWEFFPFKASPYFLSDPPLLLDFFLRPLAAFHNLRRPSGLLIFLFVVIGLSKLRTVRPPSVFPSLLLFEETETPQEAESLPLSAPPVIPPEPLRSFLVVITSRSHYTTSLLLWNESIAALTPLPRSLPLSTSESGE